MNPDDANAGEMLRVPTAAGLDDERVAGRRCVWCGGLPTMVLGPRLSVLEGMLRRWEPRACCSCAGREAGRVYDLHIATCARCTHREYCPDARALYALAGRG